MGKDKIPGKTIYRLSIYHRCLRRLKDAEKSTISSSALAKAAGVNPAQLRRDLTYLGTFGTRGLGYSVLELTTAIAEILGRAHLQPVVLVGAGNLGAALLRYEGFHKEGFEVVAAFDAAPDKVARRGISIPVFDVKEMPEMVKKQSVRLAILSVPVEHAQSVARDSRNSQFFANRFAGSQRGHSEQRGPRSGTRTGQFVCEVGGSSSSRPAIGATSLRETQPLEPPGSSMKLQSPLAPSILPILPRGMILPVPAPSKGASRRACSVVTIESSLRGSKLIS